MGGKRGGGEDRVGKEVGRGKREEKGVGRGKREVRWRVGEAGRGWGREMGEGEGENRWELVGEERRGGEVGRGGGKVKTTTKPKEGSDVASRVEHEH